MTYHPTGRKAGRPSNQQAVISWLQEYINSGSGGMRLATRIKADGQERGYSLRTLVRAKKALGFTSIRVGGLASDGDWLWANPRMLSVNKSITQELAEKLDRHEKRIAEALVTTKAQSRARIANGWLRQVTEELFDKGRTLAEIREDAAKQDPYLTTKDFADIEEEFTQVALSELLELERTKTKAEETYEATRVRLTQAVIAGNATLGNVETEMRHAETAKTQAVESVQQKLVTLEKQIGVVLFHRLTKGQQAA